MSTETEGALAVERKSSALSRGVQFLQTRGLMIFIAPILITIVLIVFGQIANPGFGSLANVGDLLAISSVLTIAASGQTAVVISGGGGIDLSLGALMSMGAVLGSGLLNGLDLRIPLAIVVLLAMGGLFGFFNGAGVWWARIPPLVMTLGMATVVNGFTLFVSHGKPFGSPSPLLLAVGGDRIVGPLRWLVVVAVAFVVGFTLLFRRTKYGRMLFLVGNNRTAAELAGISVRTVILGAYTFAGMMYSLGGLFLLSFVGTAQMQMASAYTLQSIAAVVLGGTQLTGGRGTYVGTALGALVLVTLSSVLITIGMTPGVRSIVTGFVLAGILAAYSRQPKLRQ